MADTHVDVPEKHKHSESGHEEHGHDRHPILTAIIRVLGIIEDIILTAIALVLIILAALLLINGILELVRAVADADLGSLSLDILENVLLVAVIMEIVYTVMLSLRSHELAAEPFLVVGIIAAIRRILEITIKSSGLDSSSTAFQGLLAELGLLAIIVFALAASVYIVRRSQKFTLKLPSVALAEASENHG